MTRDEFSKVATFCIRVALAACLYMVGLAWLAVEWGQGRAVQGAMVAGIAAVVGSWMMPDKATCAAFTEWLQAQED